VYIRSVHVDSFRNLESQTISAISGQVIVTTTDEKLVDELRGGSERVFFVRTGRIVLKVD